MIWWQRQPVRCLVDVLSQVNNSRARQSAVDQSDTAFSALNLAWNHFHEHRSQTDNIAHSERRRRTDAEAFPQLLLTGLTEEQREHLLQSEQLDRLVRLSPKVMDHSILLAHGYDPQDIPVEIKQRAEAKHQALTKLFLEYKAGLGDATADSVIGALTKLLYVVRSNIKHGEKTPAGPDWRKVQRDRQVCEVTNPVLELVLDMVLDYPSKRLAVYGTLLPGEPNNVVLKPLTGEWSVGHVKGVIDRAGYLPTFRWNVDADEARIGLFTSVDLPAHFPDIDVFEGKDYRRILVPVRLEDQTVVVANIYESVSD